MCNDIRNTIPTRAIDEAFSQLRISLFHPHGLPNLEPREDIRITDSAPIVRRDAEGRAELVQRRWSWPAPNGKPVFNFRADGRRFGEGRCLVPVDGFYEFTDPGPAAGGKKGRKSKWLFTKAGEDWFCLAGLWRPSPVGEAFTILTMPPGPDVAPFHDRQVAVLEREDWARWLDPAVPSAEVLRVLPAGALEVRQVA